MQIAARIFVCSHWHHFGPIPCIDRRFVACWRLRLGKLVAAYYDEFQVAHVYAAAMFIILLSALINALLEKLR